MVRVGCKARAVESWDGQRDVVAGGWVTMPSVPGLASTNQATFNFQGRHQWPTETLAAGTDPHHALLACPRSRLQKGETSDCRCRQHLSLVP